ncbi:ABC transporter permease [bacterium]|nr:ABC transporter permease [bacterium]NUP93670.1 ABC transporter permease [Candidatus Omnitrophota bacterium]
MMNLSQFSDPGPVVVEQAPSDLLRPFRSARQWFEQACRHAGALSILLGMALVRIFQPPFRFRQWIAQMEQVGVHSLAVALLTATFTGMVMVLQTGVQLGRFQSETMTPGIAGIALLREIAPVLTSLAIAARVGAGITAELGTMKVTEQIDALESIGTDPIHYLVVPRLVACMVMVPALTILADMVGILGGCLIGVTKLGISVRSYLDITFHWVAPQDFYSGFLKTVVFGGIVATIGSYLGLRSSGGAEGVGTSTTRSVVAAFILILISDYFLTEILLKVL